MSAPRRLGVLGGTFDPIHLGHLVIASEVHHALGLDEVLLVPAGEPWQKGSRAVTPPEHRLRMVELAVDGDPRLGVSGVDIDRDGPTYSIDTVRDLRRQHGADTEIYFLVGADALAGVPTWHDADRFVDEVVLVGVERPGSRLVAPPGLPQDRVTFVETTPVDLSSTVLRERVRTGAPIRYLVPAPVERHIHEHDLYREAA